MPKKVTSGLSLGKFKVNTKLLYTASSTFFIVVGSFLAIQYAKGNFRLTHQGFVPESGLLAANSFPTGAEIRIDNKLISATDDTLYLEPGQYKVEIIKDGYSSWLKELKIEKELVTQTNAQLFPLAPSLTPLTFTGVENITPSPDGQKLLYYASAASSETKNGLYVLDLGSGVLPFSKQTRQISTDPNHFDLSESQAVWSPDSSQILLITPSKQMLLDTQRKNDLSLMADVTAQRKRILSEWQEEMYLRERQYLSEFPEEVIAVATKSAQNVYISPDKKRLMYTALKPVTIPENLVPPVPATNTQQEQRTIVPGTIYIYDREEDKNFAVGQDAAGTKDTPTQYKQLLANDLYLNQPISLESSPSAFSSLQATTSAQTAANFNRYHTPLYTHRLQWFPDSKHIFYTENNHILIKEYDDTNHTSLYSGPFINDFVYPWPDGSKLIIVTSFSPDTAPNLYAIELK